MADFIVAALGSVNVLSSLVFDHTSAHLPIAWILLLLLIIYLNPFLRRTAFFILQSILGSAALFSVLVLADTLLWLALEALGAAAKYSSFLSALTAIPTEQKRPAIGAAACTLVYTASSFLSRRWRRYAKTLSGANLIALAIVSLDKAHGSPRTNIDKLRLLHVAWPSSTRPLQHVPVPLEFIIVPFCGVFTVYCLALMTTWMKKWLLSLEQKAAQVNSAPPHAVTESETETLWTGTAALSMPLTIRHLEEQHPHPPVPAYSICSFTWGSYSLADCSFRDQDEVQHRRPEVDATSLSTNATAARPVLSGVTERGDKSVARSVSEASPKVDTSVPVTAIESHLRGQPPAVDIAEKRVVLSSKPYFPPDAASTKSVTESTRQASKALPKAGYTTAQQKPSMIQVKGITSPKVSLGLSASRLATKHQKKTRRPQPQKISRKVSQTLRGRATIVNVRQADLPTAQTGLLGDNSETRDDTAIVGTELRVAAIAPLASDIARPVKATQPTAMEHSNRAQRRPSRPYEEVLSNVMVELPGNLDHGQLQQVETFNSNFSADLHLRLASNRRNSTGTIRSMRTMSTVDIPPPPYMLSRPSTIRLYG